MKKIHVYVRNIHMYTFMNGDAIISTKTYKPLPSKILRSFLYSENNFTPCKIYERRKNIKTLGAS